VSIARALVRDAPIIILDEPTSALDPSSEQSVLDALRNLIAGRTTFVIAHRMSTVAGADEVVVIDGGSQDDTSSIAVARGARVLCCCCPTRTIGSQRNCGIAAARNEWVLALDADERVTPELVAELRALLADDGPAPAHDAYRIRFRNFYLGRELRRGRWARDWHARLFRRRYRFQEVRVHEGLEPVRSVGELRGAIVHRPYRDLAHHLRKMLLYAQLGAEELRARGKRATLWHLTARPAWRFLRDYVGYRSFLDGRFGLLMSALSALSAFLKYAFLYTME
jgi:glycosyltransferase involved in cell wall biosynthesis